MRGYYGKALESDGDRARHALALIGEFFRNEREIAQAPTDKKLKVRQTQSKPIVDAFFTWCDAEAPLVLDETPISKGIG
jgi:transposase